MQCKVALYLYHGETSRTLFTRTKEHISAYTKNLKDYLKQKHQTIFHPNFTMKALQFYKDPPFRQINKGIRINQSKSTPGYLMNSRSEFWQGEVARVNIVRGLGLKLEFSPLTSTKTKPKLVFLRYAADCNN